MVVDDVDRAAVRSLLGREPRGAFEVVVRDAGGEPVVIRNAPLLDDGTPMPTRWWLVGQPEVLAVSRLESAGGVRRAETDVGDAAIADAHRRYAAERDAALPAGATTVPSGGVGGTRHGVKCLHAHYAWFLAGGDDPVGRWVAARLAERLDVDVAATSTSFSHAGHDMRIPVGAESLLVTDLIDPDPPTAVQLTNAIGRVTDHVDDVVRELPGIGDADDVHVCGAEPWHLATVERGGPPGESSVPVGRDEAEAVFRALATESRAERLAEPGLDPARVDTVLGTCCVVVAVMRRLQLPRLVFEASVG